MTEQQAKSRIIAWFKLVCNGIRQEYERGASHRELKIDVTYLKELLEILSKQSK